MDDELAAELGESFSRGGAFLLHYLPSITMATGHVLGMDALARWNHPTRGFVRPSQFFPLAERIGILGAFTEWVLKTAFRQLHVWLDDGYDLTVSVNLSPANLLDERLAHLISAQVRALSVPAERIALEIPQATILSADASIESAAAALKATGVFLTVDSATVGSSLDAATRIGARGIKYDRGVLGQMSEPHGRERLATDIAEAKRRSLVVCAEGIEDGQTYEALHALGCEVAVGYLMSRPLPALDVVDWLHNSPWGLKGTET